MICFILTLSAVLHHPRSAPLVMLNIRIHHCNSVYRTESLKRIKGPAKSLRISKI